MGSNNVTFHASFLVGTVQFLASLGSHLCDIGLRVRLWSGTVFSEQCDSMLRRAVYLEELPMGSGTTTLFPEYFNFSIVVKAC